MKMELSEKVRLAEQVSHQMANLQCTVLSATLGFASPMLEVDKAPLGLRDKAFEIKEVIDGQINTAYVANISGCRIVWRSPA